MTRDGAAPRLERTAGRARSCERPRTSKDTILNDEQVSFFANELVPQGMSNGFAPASDFTIAPVPRSTRQFLTRKLWGVGNNAPYGHRGDLTTITEAIYFHGGEARVPRDAFFGLPQADRDAVVEFLKSLQVVPERAGEVVRIRSRHQSDR